MTTASVIKKLKINQQLPVSWRLFWIPWVFREQKGSTDITPRIQILALFKEKIIHHYSIRKGTLRFLRRLFIWQRWEFDHFCSLTTYGMQINIHLTGKFWLFFKILFCFQIPTRSTDRFKGKGAKFKMTMFNIIINSTKIKACIISSKS